MTSLKAKKKVLSPIAWDNKSESVILLDQRELPYNFKEIEIKTYVEMADAIRDMALRGAPLIGIAAAYGMALAAKEGEDLNKADKLLRSTRPTAVNLMWALDLIQSLRQEWIATSSSTPRNDAYKEILEKAKWIHQDDIERCKKMSEIGAEYIRRRHCDVSRHPERSEGSLACAGDSSASPQNDKKLRILTHCNAGALATGGYGTALGVIRKLHEEGLVEMVYSDETRPRQQGSRLTAWELAYEEIPVTMISDGMAAHCMKQGMIDLVIVGSDRITANGDVANKIGTYQVAIVAKHHGVPFYVAAPESTIDRTLESGDLIPIEERDASELHTINGELVTADQGVEFFNPGFDVTPSEMVEAIFTEVGIFNGTFK